MAMTQEQILQLITEGLTSTFQLDPSRITLDATLYDDLDIDSIDAVDLAAKLQRATGTRLSPEVFKSVRTVGDLVTALDGLLNSAHSAPSA
ncbi:MAG: acyl carrier protein [Gemmatimonadaceae bacterium]|jgi:acyl carrier protein|nr:acyl carrier protein [Gemmatimonadaceae bacterium]